MLVNVILALIIYLLAGHIVILKEPVINYMLWAAIVFVVVGAFVPAPTAEGRNRWLW